jgi:pimeloyl-ACP methyl ester carboxylesterase
MTIAMVHGNPETDAIWGPLVERLGRDDIVLLSPPGFGAPAPEGWGATVEEYRAWLAGELERIGEPVDLVGHDWGGGHVMNVAMTRPELLRSWVTDVIGIYDPEYVWHELAQIWQAEGDGEAAVAAQLGAPVAIRAARLAGFGMAPTIAETVAAGFDATMGECILKLYRDAAQPRMAELGADLERAAARPGLAIAPSEDTFVGSEEMRARAAKRAGARLEALDGLGHWWMTQDPGRGAEVLTTFWASI